MTRPTEIPLILGGHSFITQLGNDPAASAEEQQRIVESCLELGIRWFDTTYQPERVALGKALNALGRRDEATILAWNFFKSFSPGDSVGEAEYYRPQHIEIILEELRTAYVDCLVMVPLDDPEENQRQEELLIEWQRERVCALPGPLDFGSAAHRALSMSEPISIRDPTIQHHNRRRGPNLCRLQEVWMGNVRHIAVCSWVGAGPAHRPSVVTLSC